MSADEGGATPRHQGAQRIPVRFGFPAVQAADDAELLGLVTEPVDLAMLASLRELIDTATVAFQSFDYARALERTEAFFWNFCDNHVELVKVRAYGEGEGAQSARAALQLGLSALLRLFAPCLPFVTEEVWSWWMPGSIHRADWPKSAELAPPTLGETRRPRILKLGRSPPECWESFAAPKPRPSST